MTNADLINTLEKLLELVQHSQESAWASMEIDEIQKELGQYIKEIKVGNLKNLKKLQVLFAPTGPIQEISLDNGWGEQFVKLAGEIDRLINQ